MIGYVIYPTKMMEEKKVDEILKRLITFEIFKKASSNNHTLIFFRNKYPNNYVFEDDIGLIAATGTFIFKKEIGINAIEKLSSILIQNKVENIPYNEFTGPYNIIYFDKMKKNILLFTDREGLQAGFESEVESGKVFSSNLLIVAALTDAGIDFESVKDFIHIGSTVNRKTIFKEIKRIESGTVYKENEDGWVKKRLWNIKIREEYGKLSDREIVDGLEEKMIDSMDFIRKFNENEVCTDLSGGTDSRTILAVLLKILAKVEINVAGPKENRDVMIHKKIAEKLKLVSLWYPDPIANFKLSREKMAEAIEISDGTRNPISLMPAVPFYKERANKYKIMLGGNGGPLFKDHFWLFEFNRLNKNREPNWSRIARLSTIDYTWQDGIFNGDENEGERLAKIYENHSRKINGKNNQKLDFVYFDLKLKGYHSPQFTTCNQFFNVYHPFCDGRLVEFAISIRPYIRKRANLQFQIIFNNNKELAWVPTDNGCPAVPSRGRYFYLYSYVLLRYARALWRKIGMYILRKNVVQSVFSMAPIYEQLKNQGYVKRFLNNEKMKTISMFKPNEIKRMTQDPYMSSNLDYLLNIIAVEIFLEWKSYLETGNNPLP